jgi:hypothetical protein
MKLLDPHKPTGWVADYCLICHDVKAHTIMAPRGTGDPLLIETCESCGMQELTHRQSVLNIAASRPDSIVELIKRTRPHLPAWCLEPIGVSRMIVEGKLDATQRAEALRLPFEIVVSREIPPYDFEHNRLTVVLGVILSAIFGPLVCKLIVDLVCWLSPKLNLQIRSRNDAWLYAAGFVVPGVILFARYVWQERGRRKAQIERMLARALRPLRPTAEELSDVEGWLRLLRHPLAKMVNFPRVASSMRQLTDTALRNVEESQIEDWGRRIEAEAKARDQTGPSSSSENEPN